MAVRRPQFTVVATPPSPHGVTAVHAVRSFLLSRERPSSCLVFVRRTRAGEMRMRVTFVAVAVGIYSIQLLPALALRPRSRSARAGIASRTVTLNETLEAARA